MFVNQSSTLEVLIYFLFSDEKSNSSGEETSPCDASKMSHLLICGEEGNTINVAIVLDFTVALISEESFDCVVELVLVKVLSNVSHSVMRPVSMLNSMQKTIVLCHPKTIF